MRVAAVMVTRNERAYLPTCLRHLKRNGIDVHVIDNESTDDTLEILASPEFAPHVIGVGSHPFDGVFDWTGLLQARERAASRLDADWILFVSSDEMMHSYREGETLSAAIARIAAEGCDVIDFNEFVFLPVDGDYQESNGFPPLQHYYFFEPCKPRLMRARRADLAVSHMDAGGHTFTGEFKLAHESLALRHYIVRTQEHALSKYQQRVFRRDELERGWHANRVNKPLSGYILPPASSLKRLDNVDSRALDRSSPLHLHYWEWAAAA